MYGLSTTAHVWSQHNSSDVHLGLQSESSDVEFFTPDYEDYVDPVSNATRFAPSTAPPYLSWADDPMYAALILGQSGG